MKPIIGESQFIETLDSWVFKNTQKDAQWLSKQKATGIPQMFRNYSQALYRGMFVDETFFESLGAGGVKFDNYTSWTKDEKVALKFAKDRGSSGKNATGNIAIIVKKVIPPAGQVLDLEMLVQFMGDKQMIMLGMDELSVDSINKEQEVLCEKGIKLVKKDVRVLK